MIAKLFEAVYEPNYYGHYGWPWRIALTFEGCLLVVSEGCLVARHCSP